MSDCTSSFFSRRSLFCIAIVLVWSCCAIFFRLDYQLATLVEKFVCEYFLGWVRGTFETKGRNESLKKIAHGNEKQTMIRNLPPKQNNKNERKKLLMNCFSLLLYSVRSKGKSPFYGDIYMAIKQIIVPKKALMIVRRRAWWIARVVGFAGGLLFVLVHENRFQS